MKYTSLIQTILSVLEFHQINHKGSQTITAGLGISPYPESRLPGVLREPVPTSTENRRREASRTKKFKPSSAYNLLSS